jgi:hypothetical protein
VNPEAHGNLTTQKGERQKTTTVPLPGRLQGKLPTGHASYCGVELHAITYLWILAPPHDIPAFLPSNTGTAFAILALKACE